MNYSFKVYKEVLDIFYDKDIIWATEISNILWISRVIVHKVLKQLTEEKKIEKIWKWAHTRYKSLVFVWEKKEKDIDTNIIIDFKTKKLLDEIFYKFDSDWKILKWFSWFKTWVLNRNIDLQKSINSYLKIYNYLEWLENNCWLLDATDIFNKKFEKNYMKKVFYAWEYNFMEFWRSKLAEMTFYAKQSQNKNLINVSIDEIFYKLECLIKTEKIDWIAIIPWSIDRKNQLLWILKERMSLFNIPYVNIIKYYPNNIPIPQKSIKSKSWRIINAQNTIYVHDKNLKNYSKILLIDDFVWSWATLNITAQKLCESWVNEIIWFSFVWSLDLTYEVINEI